ncbi:hypothetical protein BJ912DRAFT_852498 [Pholiota molesta]|nr:hypothetical protein BJ912DRAFT_852501 [Pholiota molesta]KAF8186026.1 hypothetical protein BJ912DRAFT_852498 [Pholiota molesta]
MCIVPGEDAQHPIELECSDDDDDNDEYAGLVEDGVGAENDKIGQNDKDSDDKEDPADLSADENDAGQSGRHIRRPLPAWLLSEFQAKVKESNTRGQDGLPPLYRDHQTFWFPQKSTFFLLQQSNPTPQLLYNPRFFLWDPMALCPDGIRCLNCKSTLHRHGHLRYPRRCVDQVDSFWLIGYRYKCPECRHPKSGKHTVTFRSYDSRILTFLPRALFLEFPACLSHRSSLSNRVFSMMRSCFQNGMGPKQFSDALRVQHLQHHDTLHLQYLHSLVPRKDMAKWQGRKFEAFLSYDDNSEKGRHGFVPSMEWLRNMYDQYIEKHRNELNQHMSMLSADICAVDHSHKVTKHLAKVNGVQIFTGLLTITNEKGEIRVCNLVGSKSHDSFRHALDQMRISLDLYGHSLPSVFYTDNMADKQFLEGAFPSLRENIVPVEKYAHLEPFIIPPQIQVHVKTTPSTIDDDMRKILDALPSDGSTGQIIVGFDSEWDVEASAYGGVISRGTTAVIQIAYENTIYILQVNRISIVLVVNICSLLCFF